MVHSGDLNEGQYFALIKPDRETPWLKFENDRVTRVTDEEVLEDNYGGVSTDEYTLVQARNQQTKTNAYILVYIRNSRIDKVLAPLTEADTPVHISACYVL
jgi:ubiquitin carboxyl-terminal hydrolase 7